MVIDEPDWADGLARQNGKYYGVRQSPMYPVGPDDVRRAALRGHAARNGIAAGRRYI
jgi:hypothetical protein